MTGRPEVGAVTMSIQHRCPQMVSHKPFGSVPVPCADCYSLHVTAEVMPWQPSIPSSPTNPTPKQPAP